MSWTAGYMIGIRALSTTFAFIMTFTIAVAEDKAGRVIQPTLAAKEIPDPKKWCSTFVDLLKRDPKAAFETASQAGLPADGVDRLRASAGKLEDSFGAISKSELIEESRVAKSLVKETYLLEQERAPTMQTCLFYYLPSKRIWILFGLERTADIVRLPFK